jgi:hypothetical protein
VRRPNPRLVEGPVLPKEPIEVELAEGAIAITLKAVPLPKELTEFLLLQASSIRDLTKSQAIEADFAPALGQVASRLSEEELMRQVKERISGSSSLPAFESLRALGPRGMGPNLLFVEAEGPLSR